MSLGGVAAVAAAGVVSTVILALVAPEWCPPATAGVRMLNTVNSIVSQSGPLVTAATAITQLGVLLALESSYQSQSSGC